MHGTCHFGTLTQSLIADTSRSAGASVEETTVGLLPDVRERARAELEEEAASANMDAT